MANNHSNTLKKQKNSILDFTIDTSHYRPNAPRVVKSIKIDY